MRKYLFLALAFILAMSGMFAGAALNDRTLMVLWTLPGLFAIVGFMLIYGRGR